MESWGHFENRSKAALGNKKARFHCARLHLHCSHVMRLYRTNLIINNLKERTNHGKPLKPAWREPPIYIKNGFQPLTKGMSNGFTEPLFMDLRSTI